MEINIDASSLRSSACLLAWYRTVAAVHGPVSAGYRQPINGASLVYGTAFHKFVDTMYKTGDLAKARDEARKSFEVPKRDDRKKLWLSDFKHLLGTCFDYWERYIKTDSTFEPLVLTTGEKATEATFRFKYRTCGDVTIWLCGTIDKIGKIKNGCYAIGDYKTTSAWDNDGFFQSFELSVQLRFYVFALQWMAKYHPETILGKIGATPVGTFIDAVFLNQSIVENVYKRSEVFTYKPEHMVEFKYMLDYQIDRLANVVMAVRVGNIKRPFKEGIINGSCTKQYGKCEYWHVCAADNDSIADILLKRDFTVKEFNPLKYNE